MTDAPSATISDAELGHLFRHTSRLMARAFHRRDNAGHAQARVLSILRERGPMSQRDLLALLDVRSSSLSEILSKLEAGGLIARERNPDDRRGFILSATGAGLALSETDADAREPDFFACLDAPEKAQLAAILTKIATALREEPTTDEGFPGGPRGRGLHGRGPGRGFGRGSGKGFGKGRGRR